jgi:hypothetical protein
MDQCLTTKKRAFVTKAIKTYIKNKFGLVPYTYFHSTKSDINSQIADYFCWAIKQKWDDKEIRPFNEIKTSVKSEFDIFKRGYRLAQAAYKLEPDNQLFLSNLTFYYEVAYIEYAGDVDWTGMLDILNYQESKNIKPEDTYKKGEFAMLRGMIYLVMEDKENAKKYIDECESIDKRTFAKAIKTLRKDLKKLG